jgi:hypothetical protein
MNMFLNRVIDRKAPLLLALSLFAIDSTVTMIGQPPYAQRIAGHINEGNAVFAFAMRNGWFTHIAITLIWISVISLTITAFPKVIGLAFSFAWTIGHSLGALSWLAYDRRFHLGFWIVYPFCLMVGLAAAFAAKSVFASQKTESTRLPA